MFYFVPCSLSGVIERRRILAEAQGRVLLARRRVELMKQAYDSSKSLLQEGIYNENKTSGDFNFGSLLILLSTNV